jgi:CRISPR-associated protein Cas2
VRAAPPISGKYRAVWIFAMFDLPVTTPAKRRRCAQFRKLLIKSGFCKLQFSVYARYYSTEESSEPARALIRDHLPPEGHVRLLTVTDGQFGKQHVFHCRKPARAEGAPQQFMLF